MNSELQGFRDYGYKRPIRVRYESTDFAIRTTVVPLEVEKEILAAYGPIIETGRMRYKSGRPGVGIRSVSRLVGVSEKIVTTVIRNAYKQQRNGQTQ